MFCPNCGKSVKDFDKFCRYCGLSLQAEICEDVFEKDIKKSVCEDVNIEEVDSDYYDEEIDYTPNDNEDELVLYDVKKHYMALFWSIALMPVFFMYFWTIFMQTHSVFSWILGALILIPVIYPLMRYYSDKIIITNKFVHIKHGIFNIEEIDIPIRKIRLLHFQQSFVGSLCNYGDVFFESPTTGKLYNFKYAKDYDELKDIIINPVKFIKEAM